MGPSQHTADSWRAAQLTESLPVEGTSRWEVSGKHGGQGHGWLGLLTSASPRAQMGEVSGGWRRGLWPGKH